MKREKIEHPFPPLYDSGSKILILGSFPSVKSREQMFFYGHPQNRFWKVIAAVMGKDGEEIPVPETIEEKKDFLHRYHIALWDVIASCEIEGSSDASIRSARPNDLSPIFEAADIRGVFANGGVSYRMYQKYQLKTTGREARKLPSTSPANAAWSLDRLISRWREVILPLLQRAAASLTGVRE